MKLKEHILTELLKHPQQDLSGQRLCETYGVSRTAVWKAIQSLRKDGYPIESTTHRGYRLTQTINRLDPARISLFLEKSIPLYVLDDVDSTNTYAKKLVLDGAEDGTLIVANHQSAGKGRQGHVFFSPADTGLYLSIILRPHKNLEALLKITLAAAVASTQAIEKVAKTSCEIKWVNDLFIGKQKIGGILTEATTDFETRQIDSIIIGIGINCHPMTFPSDLSTIAGSLNNEHLDRNELAATIYERFIYWNAHLETKALINEYKSRSLLLGKTIFYTEKGIKKQGYALDINDQGNLVVEKENGENLIMHSGEVSVKDWQ